MSIRIAVSLLEALKQPFTIAGRRHDLSCSIGIAMHPADQGDAERLLGFANIAMHDQAIMPSSQSVVAMVSLFRIRTKSAPRSRAARSRCQARQPGPS